MPQDLPNTYRHPLPNGLYYDMIRVRPGVFVMGSEEEGAYSDEKPEHLVRITQDYYIGVYPVTQAVWKAVMDGHNPYRSNPSSSIRQKEGCHFLVILSSLIMSGCRNEASGGMLRKLKRYNLPTIPAHWQKQIVSAGHCL